jgi:hypothetical protein
MLNVLMDQWNQARDIQKQDAELDIVQMNRNHHKEIDDVWRV